MVENKAMTRVLSVRSKSYYSRYHETAATSNVTLATVAAATSISVFKSFFTHGLLNQYCNGLFDERMWRRHDIARTNRIFLYADQSHLDWGALLNSLVGDAHIT